MQTLPCEYKRLRRYGIRKAYLYTIASHPVSPVVLVSLTPVDVFSLVTPVGIFDRNTSYALRQMQMTEFPQRQRAKESFGISISIVSAQAFF